MNNKRTIFYPSSRKSAFTLAEVLITFGIIGIVAAMTLPTLIANHQNSQLRTAFKKTYSTMSQATQRTILEDYGGTISGTDFSELHNNLVKYLVKSSICSYGSANCDTSIFPFDNFGDSAPLSNWTSTHYSSIAHRNLLDDGMIALNDGGFVFLDYGNGIGNMIITIDTNGWRKKPNKGGLDVFSFILLENGTLSPMGAESISPYYNNNCYNSPNNYCAGIALGDDDYFKKVKR